MGIDQELPGAAWSGGEDRIFQPDNAVRNESGREE
jgi:hypothetical protein